MRSKKVSIVLDDTNNASDSSARGWMSQTVRGRVRGPKWLVTASLCALIILTFLHWRSLQNHGRFSSSFDATTKDLTVPVGESVDTRKDLLSQAAVSRAEHKRPREEKHPLALDRDDISSESSVSISEDDTESEGRVTKMTEAQIRTLDASMDDWSETKRRGMQWVFEKYVLPGSPEALESIPVSKDPRDRPGYFRPGNWDWTMTKLGEYEASLYSPPSDELPKQRFPQAIIIGSGHCGTRALLDFLQMHPNVVVAHSEVHFFDRYFYRGMDWYRGQMPYSFSNQITLEKSPSYVMVPEAAKEVYTMDKNVKLLMVVKDPVVSLMSAFSRSVSMTENRPIHYSFLKTVNGERIVRRHLYPVARGFYSVHLKTWLQYFPLSQFHIVDGGALVKDPVPQIQAVERFLEIPPKLTSENFFFNKTKGFYCKKPFTMREPKCLGQNKGRPHVPLTSDVKELLYDFYRPHNQEFFSLIGKTFDWEPK